ncbi:MAG: HAMP domain-containing sensor histidine kinase [Gemmatimonadaceae bacterium]
MGNTPQLEIAKSDSPFENCILARVLADRMRENRDDLTRRWLDRISARVSVDPNRIFPTDALLDHVPILILGIADYIENPENVILSDIPVVAKAMELGELRFSQGFDEYELLKEYEIFGGILFSFLSRTADSIDEPCSRGELLACAHRLFLAVALIQQATLTHYLSLVKERLSEREQRLRAFNRSLSHELRNLMGTIGGAADILELGATSEEEQRTMVSIIVRNTASMKVSLENLVELSRLDEDARRSRHVSLPKAASEVIRQLREAARALGVELRLAPDLPAVDVSAAAFELCLSNLVSNAIKYSDRAKPKRWVEISGKMVTPVDGPAETVVVVRDNGLGVPEAKRAHLFERFFRAHQDTQQKIDGTGLGLSIVRETAASMGGRAWAEFPDEGSAFYFSIPTRRTDDQARVGNEGSGTAIGSDGRSAQGSSR